MTDDDATRSHTRDAFIEDALAAVLELLHALPDTAKTRELRARVGTYRSTLDRWAAVEPQPAQRSALRELVFELHARVLEAHRQLPRAGPGGSVGTPPSTRRR